MSMTRDVWERELVRRLCKRVGYGFVMREAEALWREGLATESPSAVGGELSVGPCVAFLVPCECRTGRVDCDWCCASGRVTKKVREAQRAARKASAR